MANKLFQGIIHQMSDSVDKTIGVIDENDVVIACSELTRVGEMRHGIREELAYSKKIAVKNGYTYYPIDTNSKWDYFVFVEGIDSESAKIASVLAVSFANIKMIYDEKYDLTSFIRNILLENILPSDIFIKSKELHLNPESYRVCIILSFISDSDVSPFEIVRNMYPDDLHDFVISFRENEIILIKEYDEKMTSEDVEKACRTLADTIGTEFYTDVAIGIGSVINNIKDLPRSYKEARTALEVGKIFDNGKKKVLSVENLGIGRLVCQLPVTLCENFLDEVFRKGAVQSLDNETLQTIDIFFENNLNVSETARQLFIHRNTLVYRLDKIQKNTGLDLRDFYQAITFRVAVMVNKYLETKGIRHV